MVLANLNVKTKKKFLVKNWILICLLRKFLISFTIILAYNYDHLQATSNLIINGAFFLLFLISQPVYNRKYLNIIHALNSLLILLVSSIFLALYSKKNINFPFVSASNIMIYTIELILFLNLIFLVLSFILEFPVFIIKLKKLGKKN